MARLTNEKLIKRFREETGGCLMGCWNQSVGHHVITKGANGPDLVENLMPLCKVHHDEIHATSINYMSNTYWEIKSWLNYFKWEHVPAFEEQQEKWIPPFKY